MTNHQLASFGGHRHRGSGDIMTSVCHMILQDHVTESSCNFMDRSLSRQVAVLPGLVAIDTVVVKI